MTLPSKRLLALLAGLAVAVTSTLTAGQADQDLERALQVLKAAPLIDGHNDAPWVIRSKAAEDVEGYDLRTTRPSDTDIPRLRAGRVGAQFWSVYVPTSLGPLEAMTTQLEQIDIARRMIALYPEHLRLAVSVADINAAKHEKKIASLIGMEGGHTIVNSLGALRAYYALGVRYMTLTHYSSHDWADSATGEATHDGLSTFGEEVVREMNRLGMLVDLSHVSPATMDDALRVTKAPVIFSHSSAKGLVDHPRNVPDSILKRMSTNGGVVMVTFVPGFVNKERGAWELDLLPRFANAGPDTDIEAIQAAYTKERGAPPLATLTEVADHIDYVAKVAGYDHVGIGSDFFGADGDGVVTGLEDVSRFPHLFAELVRRGWSNENLAKLARENFMRAFKEAETTAARLRAARPPSLMKFQEPKAATSD